MLAGALPQPPHDSYPGFENREFDFRTDRYAIMTEVVLYPTMTTSYQGSLKSAIFAPIGYVFISAVFT